ncbi:hypothetical protein Taro_034195 [Colocasia esculenta]|uniref:Uncharacterized protein n=1 Tax=Colocasia esculenta TaxID=4460 RepID=A0A843W275_COLES|nr:hypothetical protein [Colocasia esculenta]
MPVVRRCFSHGCSVSLVVTPGCSFPTLWRSGMLGACVVRLWSHVVALVFRELHCLSGCVPMFCFRFIGVPAALASKGLVIPTEPCSRGSPPYSLQVGTRYHRGSLPDDRGGGLLRRALPALFEFIAYLAGLNSNPSGSSDPWVAARPSGAPGGGPGGRVVIVEEEDELGSWEARGALELGGRGVQSYEKAHLGWFFKLR